MRCLILALLITVAPAGLAETPLTVAVAANFRPTLEDINARFSAQTGHPVRLSSASTGVLTHQVMRGAPYHLFLAADAAAPALLHDEGLGLRPFCYATGQLALLGGPLSQLEAPGLGLDLAIANPDTAPYGQAAMDVLNLKGTQPQRLVRGNNVLQAYQYWRTRTVQMALVSKSLAGEAGIAIPAKWHRDLQQHALVIKDHPNLNAYLEWLRSDTVRQLILDSGYLPCP
ncbi:molybdate ABC transporter substrate-binding protein [Halioglobus japonicus]|uniref:Molybdate ABC transporter substrate-binding protein n=1 Tax=Halioglobus japonicus TaxID=930805 RepID=A0AAP8MCP2_9GAMM|nr:molybdate ABC transporter substrate-binding protein [Halioglobus japonicus]AQA17218.1 molybdate ABC transporter substrate-binding protein [Halioglobus japonicus]PLW85132.1 molybdate ABC transporter substrate-binding protein [Halioglobus japonicus]GHD19619.1 molybdate ABC transporter substrate-binding protein [Halioglobus japonicus]